MPAFLQRRVVWPGLIASLAALTIAFPLRATDKNPVIVHEWGTFTSLQDEKGNAIGGINVDDEPVPNFVDGDGGQPVVSLHSSWSLFGLPPYSEDKQWEASDPAVTMRLETPVLYIYPPKGQAAKSVPPLTVHVDFHGGVLSEFYPEAKFEGLGLIPGTNMHRETLTGATTTSLTWNDVRLGSTRKPIETDDHVWTTPRETSAPLLEVKTHSYDAQGKLQDDVTAEHFLFYRGVGHLDSPVKMRTRQNSKTFVCTDADPALILSSPAWLVEIRPDGGCAFRAVKLDDAWISFAATYMPGFFLDFSPNDFSASNLTTLQASMQAELVKQGLYPDEASAMLRTWELSYFKSPGLRFFYIAPRPWVDKVLPLAITGAPTKITRVMIGRIELISTAQKAALARLAAGPCPDLDAVKKAANQALASGNYTNEEAKAFRRGDRPLRDLGIAIPPSMQDYLDLGRFRDALVLHEQKINPSPTLAVFIQRNKIGVQASDANAAKTNDVANSLTAAGH